LNHCGTKTKRDREREPGKEKWQQVFIDRNPTTRPKVYLTTATTLSENQNARRYAKLEGRGTRAKIKKKFDIVANKFFVFPHLTAKSCRRKKKDASFLILFF
jgi:hypothetical protein